MTIKEYCDKKIGEKTGLSLEKINSVHGTEIQEEIKKKINLINEPLSEHRLYKCYTEKEKNERDQLLIEYSR